MEELKSPDILKPVQVEKEEEELKKVEVEEEEEWLSVWVSCLDVRFWLQQSSCVL